MLHEEAWGAVSNAKDVLSKVEVRPLLGHYSSPIPNHVFMELAFWIGEVLKTLSPLVPVNEYFIASASHPVKLLPTLWQQLNNYPYSVCHHKADL